MHLFFPFLFLFVSHLIIDPSEINQGASANLDRKRDRKEVTNSCLRQLFTQINDYVCDTNPSFENQPQNVTIYYCVSKDLKTLNAIDKTNLVVSIEMKAVLRPINQGSLVSAFFILEKHALQMFWRITGLRFKGNFLGTLTLATKVTMVYVRLILSCLKNRPDKKHNNDEVDAERLSQCCSFQVSSIAKQQQILIRWYYRKIYVITQTRQLRMF